MAEEVLLFGVWASPFSRRVEIALKLKGIQYKYFEEDLKNKSPSLLKYNPVHKKIPVLVHNGKPIAESQVILEYIDETWPGYPIFPKDPYDRAIARFWAKFIDEKCLPAIYNAFWGEKEQSEKIAKEACDLLKHLENEIGEKKYFGGETIGFVDIVASAIGFWLRIFEETSGKKLLTREEFPKFSNWADVLVSSSGIKENLPPKDKLIAYFQIRFGILVTDASK